MINPSWRVGINFGRYVRISNAVFDNSVHFLILNDILKKTCQSNSSSRCRVSECYYYKYKQSSRRTHPNEPNVATQIMSRGYINPSIIAQSSECVSCPIIMCDAYSMLDCAYSTHPSGRQYPIHPLSTYQLLSNVTSASHPWWSRHAINMSAACES